MIDGILARLIQVELGIRALDVRVLRNRAVAVGQWLSEESRSRRIGDLDIGEVFYIFRVLGCCDRPLPGVVIEAVPSDGSAPIPLPPTDAEGLTGGWVSGVRTYAWEIVGVATPPYILPSPVGGSILSGGHVNVVSPDLIDAYLGVIPTAILWGGGYATPGSIGLTRSTLTGLLLSGSITGAGSGYTAEPTAVILPDGRGGAVRVEIAGGSLSRVDILDPGHIFKCAYGCIDPVRYDGVLVCDLGSMMMDPQRGVFGVLGAGTASVQLGPTNCTFNQSGDFSVVFEFIDSSTTATATPAIGVGGAITGITLSDAGLGYYDTLPAVTIDPPPPWAWPRRQATAHATLSYDDLGTLASIVVDDPGEGYDPTNPPAIAIDDPNGTVYSLTGLVHVCRSLAGNPTPDQPVVTTNPFDAWDTTNPTVLHANVLPSSVACDPFAAAFDFTGTALDGVAFQGSVSRVVTWQAP